MQHILFPLGFRPTDPAGAAYSAPDPQLHLRGPTFKGKEGKEGEVKGQEGKEERWGKEGKEGKGRDGKDA